MQYPFYEMEDEDATKYAQIQTQVNRYEEELATLRRKQERIPFFRREQEVRMEDIEGRLIPALQKTMRDMEEKYA